MSPELSNLEIPVLARVLRRTILTSLALGLVAAIVAFLIAPVSAFGVVLGVGVAILNFRFLDAGVAKVETKGETDKKVVRRLLATRTATRLGVVTALAIGLVFLDGPMGIGMVAGVVVFQVVYVIHVGRVVLAEGIS